MLERLGRAAARWRLAILAVWAALAVVGGVFGAGVYDRTQTVDDARGESARAQERLDGVLDDGNLAAQRVVHLAHAGLAPFPEHLQDHQLAAGRFDGSWHGFGRAVAVERVSLTEPNLVF